MRPAVHREVARASWPVEFNGNGSVARLLRDWGALPEAAI